MVSAMRFVGIVSMALLAVSVSQQLAQATPIGGLLNVGSALQVLPDVVNGASTLVNGVTGSLAPVTSGLSSGLNGVLSSSLGGIGTLTGGQNGLIGNTLRMVSGSALGITSGIGNGVGGLLAANGVNSLSAPNAPIMVSSPNGLANNPYGVAALSAAQANAGNAVTTNTVTSTTSSASSAASGGAAAASAASSSSSSSRGANGMMFPNMLLRNNYKREAIADGMMAGLAANEMMRQEGAGLGAGMGAVGAAGFGAGAAAAAGLAGGNAALETAATVAGVSNAAEALHGGVAGVSGYDTLGASGALGAAGAIGAARAMGASAAYAGANLASANQAAAAIGGAAAVAGAQNAAVASNVLMNAAGRQVMAADALRNAQAESAVAGAEMAQSSAINARSASLASNAYRQAKLAGVRDRVNIAGTIQNSARISDAAIATHDAATKAEDSLLGSELAVDSAATVFDSDGAYIPPVTASLLRSLPYGRLGLRNIIPKPLTLPSPMLPDVWLNGMPVNYVNAAIRLSPTGTPYGPGGFGLGPIGANGQPLLANNGVPMNSALVFDPASAYINGIVGASLLPILANGQLEAQDELAMANAWNAQQLNGVGMSITYQGFGRLNQVPMITGSVSELNLMPTTTIGTTYPIGSALVIEPRDSFFQDYTDAASSRQNFDERQQ